MPAFPAVFHFGLFKVLFVRIAVLARLLPSEQYRNLPGFIPYGSTSLSFTYKRNPTAVLKPVGLFVVRSNL